MELTREIATKVRDTVDAGLTEGLGKPIPGQMCIMAALAYALGRPHGDNRVKDCVGYAVRALDISLNDSPWSSNAARAKGMRRESIAKLGSNQIDQVEFAKIVALETVRQIVPIALRAVAQTIPAHKEPLEAAAVACEIVADLVSARDAASDAASAASDAESAARDGVLTRLADIAVDALIKLGSQGAQWLDLCE